MGNVRTTLPETHSRKPRQGEDYRGAGGEKCAAAGTLVLQYSRVDFVEY